MKNQVKSSSYNLDDDFKTAITFNENTQKNLDSEKSHILISTHGYGGNKDVYGITQVSKNFVMQSLEGEKRSAITFDMFAHGETKGEHLDFTLSNVYNQLKTIYEYVQELGYEKVSLHGVSASSPAILKIATTHLINKVLLRVPVLNPYEKRERELGTEGMNKWKKDGQIEVFTGCTHKYQVIEDILENFQLNYNKLSGTINIAGGELDKESQIEELEVFVEMLNDPHGEGKASLEVYEGQGHSFNGDIKPNINNYFEQANKALKG